MMRYITAYIVALLAAIVVAGCSDDIEFSNPVSDVPHELEEYYFILGNPTVSRSVEYTDDNHSEFSGGELLGCFALDESDNVVAGTKANACYAVSVISSENEAINGKKVLLPNAVSDKLDKGYAKYLFYYPYNKDIKSLSEIKNLTHSVAADQSQHDDYEKSDLLWDVAVPTDRVCSVEMDHAMANIIIVIDGVEYDVDKGAVVLGQPLTATNINLTAPDLTSMRDIDGAYYYSVSDSQEKKNIQAMYADYPTTNDRFRVAVPANRTLAKGTEIVKLWSKSTGLEKIFRLKSNITLEPGKNYYFTLIKKGNFQPEPSSEQSWVLDVLDPKTGKPVGLLCREYLRYQRSQNVDIPTTPADESGEPVLNSQAWVFYNLQDDGKTPELSKGYVLRFVYDIRTNLASNKDDPVSEEDRNGGMAWPAPHKYHQTGDVTIGSGDQGFGMYLAEHGHRWRYNFDTEYGESGVKLGDYNMHGGIVYWNGVINEISDFEMPQRNYVVTNEIARESGHIAIPANGKPYVSYSGINSGGDTDVDGNGVGFLMPHCLVDQRKNIYGKVRVVRYPLVKIGFNQFWMQKSLRAKTFTDGTPLVCYNSVQSKPKVDLPKITAMDGWNAPLIAPGYIYPMCGDGSDSEIWCDPYSIYNGDEDALDNDPDYDLTLLYNYNTFCDKRIVPKSVESISEYHTPGFPRYIALHHYLGANSVLKMMSNEIQTRNNNEAVEPYVEAFKKGKYPMAGLNTYPGNVSGFKLRSFKSVVRGQWIPARSDNGGCFWLLTDDFAKGMVMALYYYYNCWATGDNIDMSFLYGKRYEYASSPTDGKQPNGLTQNEHYRTESFAQIRLVLSFKNQSGSVVSAVAKSRATTLAVEPYDVYVAVE